MFVCQAGRNSRVHCICVLHGPVSVGWGRGKTAPLVLTSGTEWGNGGRGRRGPQRQPGRRKQKSLLPLPGITPQPSIPALFRSNSALNTLSSAAQDMVAGRSQSLGTPGRTRDGRIVSLRIFRSPCTLPNHQHSSHNMPVLWHTTNGVSRIKSTRWAPELRHSVVWSQRHTVFSRYGSRVTTRCSLVTATYCLQ